MEAIIHKQIDSLEKIQPKWTTLKEEFREITVFQDFGWIKNCWDYINKRENVTPYIVEIRNNDKTIGIIPLYCSLKKFSSINFRILKPIGTGDSDYLVPILSKDYSPKKQLRKALDKIYEDRSSWDRIEWGEIPEGSVFDIGLNSQLVERSLSIERNKGAVCPFLLLNKNLEKVEEKFSKKFLKRVFSYERKLKREGDLNYHKVVSIEEIEPVMNKLFEFHCERWEKTNTPSDFKHIKNREHTLRKAKSLFENNLLHLCYLSYNNEIAAVEYGMTDGKRRYLYIGAFNSQFSKYSVGNILLYHLIREACIKGVEIIDFLKGNEDYKKKWGTIDKFNIRYTFYNRSVKSLLFKRIRQTYYSKEFHKKSIAKQIPAKLVIRGSIFFLNVSDRFRPVLKTNKSVS